MKQLFMSLLAIGLSCVAVQGARVRSSLDKDWKFHLGDGNMAHSVRFDDSSWRSLDVPHDWAIESEFSKSNAHENGWLPGGIGWYRKEFTLEAADAGNHVEIQFDGVYKHAEVWINGQPVGVQYDGYTSFYFDITPYVEFGKANTLAVRVDNSVQPNCRWYTGSGIYRHVWLTVKDPAHIENWGTYITTPAVTKSEAVVKVVTETAFAGKAVWEFELETEIFNEAGESVAKTKTTHANEMRNTVEIEHQLSVYAPELWSLETPKIYTAVSRLTVGKIVVDESRSSFGIREIRYDAEKGFFLNGKNLKMKGVCLHAEASTFGAAVPVQEWERRLAGLKAAGCNAIRTAHNSMAPEFMNLCDRMGFLVMDEFVDKWDHEVYADPHFRSEWQKNFGETIRRDRNHPSVMIWSVGNENHAPGSFEQTESLERYCDFVRSIDPTRPVVSGMERGLDYDPAKKVDDILRSCEHMDLIGMNYGLQWSARIAHRKPGKAFVATESLPYFSSTEEKRWSHTERHNWFDVLENDSNIGMFIWVGIEYLGEIPSVGKLHSWPEIFCWPGHILDSSGMRSDLSYFYQALWTDEPTVHIAVYDKEGKYKKNWGAPPSKALWNYAAGEQVDLVTYSNCDYVELYLNDRRIGTQKLSDFSNWVMKWHQINYESGTLKAVGIRYGKPVCEFELKTAGKPTQLAVKVDRPKLVASEVVHVEIQLLDAAGNPVKHDDRLLQFAVEGGEIIALDNGDLDARDIMKEFRARKTALGSCVAVVKLDAGKNCVLNVSGDGVQAQQINL